MTSAGEFYVRCGADLLLNGLRADLEAESRCPVCDGIVHFRVKATKVEEMEPTDSLLHVVEFSEKPGTLGVKCESTHIFDKKECMNRWLDDYRGPSGSVFTLQGYIDRFAGVKVENQGRAS